MTWTKELDEAAALATKQGYWHTVLFYMLCSLAAIPTSFLVFSQVFTNATPEHWCAPSPDLERLGLPELLLRNLTVPENHGTYENCRSYHLDTKSLYLTLNIVGERVSMREFTNGQDKYNQTQLENALTSIRKELSNCSNGWKFATEHYERTLVTQFSLVCDKDWLPRTSNTLFWVGSIFGNLFFGWMSDRYGRRPTILLIILFEVPITIATSFSSNYGIYISLRVAGGLFFPALYQLPFVLALELMPPEKRTYTGIIVGMLFAGGMCLLALLAFLLRDWYYLSLATSVPFVLLFGYYWLIPESPRWLVGRGRIRDAETVYRMLAKKNGIILPPGFLIELHKTYKEDDSELEVAMIRNSYLLPLESHKEEYKDRIINNIFTYEPEIAKCSIGVPNNLENKLTAEVQNLVDKKLTRDSNIININNEENKFNHEDLHLTLDLQEKCLQSDAKLKMQNTNTILLKEPFVKKNNIVDQNYVLDCKASPLDLFRYPNIRKKFVLLSFNWVALGIIYNSLSYNTPNLGVDDYLAFFIGGAVEVPSYFIAWYSMERYGRRWVLFTFLSFGGLSCLCCVFVPEAWPWITVALAMLGRLCAAASFAVFYVQIGEMLPTVVRSQAMGASSFIAGVGLLACPYIVHLTVYFKSLPLIVMGVLSMVASITSLLLPETLNQPLPQTLEDGEMFGRNFKIISFVER